MNCSSPIKLRLPSCCRPASVMGAVSLGRWQPRLATTSQRAARPKATGARKQLGRSTQIGRGNTKPGRANPVARTMSHNGGLTRVDMMAAVLRRHPRRTVRELIALLDKEFRWKTNESAVTGKLYTRRDKFVHTQPESLPIAQSPGR